MLAGNAALLQSHNVAPQPVDLPGSVVQVARNGRLLGALVVSDRLKPQAAEAVEGLRRLGVRTIAMLTGDREEQARPVAARLKLDVLKAGLLPETKASALQALGPVKHTLFVGDGINDAPVLATAGVGVAMGGLGAEAAIETADVVILDDNPARLPELLRIARRTRTIVWQNIVMALGIKGCSWPWALWAFPALGSRVRRRGRGPYGRAQRRPRRKNRRLRRKPRRASCPRQDDTQPQPGKGSRGQRLQRPWPDIPNGLAGKMLRQSESARTRRGR